MAEKSVQIRFDELGIATILRLHRLHVPPNQREYAWEDRHVTRLLQDLANAIDADETYFLGTVVTIPDEDGSLEVVDGQQRLATTAILLAAIRDYLATKGEDFLANSIDTEILTGSDRGKRVRIPKLRLNVDDNELFNKIITAGDEDLPEASRDSHRLLLSALREARLQVRRIVAPMDDRAHGDTLERWVSFLEDRARVILLRVPDKRNAFRMFETLNDRGLRTSQADLIKNYLFGRAGDRMAEVQSKWSSMRGALESSEEDDITINFLRHALIVQLGHTTQAKVFDAVQDIARSEPATATFASGLERLANVYVATLNPEHERWNTYPDAVRRSIEVLNLLRIRPMRPLVMAIAARMDQKEARPSMEFLVSLGVRLLIASSTRSGSVEEPLADAARDVYAEKITTCRDLKSALKGVTPTDSQFQTAFEFTRVSNARLARYYLRSLEEAAKGLSEPWFVPYDDGQVINLEHVLPKIPEDKWPAWSLDDVRQNVTRLGNLALLLATQNSNLKSEAFADKKAVYEASPYLLTSQIADLDEWTPAAIDERQKGLAELALKTWPA